MNTFVFDKLKSENESRLGTDNRLARIGRKFETKP
jgi:hypothetical protein